MVLPRMDLIIRYALGNDSMVLRISLLLQGILEQIVNPVAAALATRLPLC